MTSWSGSDFVGFLGAAPLVPARITITLGVGVVSGQWVLAGALAAPVADRAYHRGMGEKQIRTETERAAMEALRPRIEALTDLAVAAAAAGEADALRAAGNAKAAKIHAAVEEEIDARFERWLKAWDAAIGAGWTPQGLRSFPVNQSPPPKKRAAKGKTVASTARVPRASRQAPGADAHGQSAGPEETGTARAA